MYKRQLVRGDQEILSDTLGGMLGPTHKEVKTSVSTSGLSRSDMHVQHTVPHSLQKSSSVPWWILGWFFLLPDLLMFVPVRILGLFFFSIYSNSWGRGASI